MRILRSLVIGVSVSVLCLGCGEQKGKEVPKVNQSDFSDKSGENKKAVEADAEKNKTKPAGPTENIGVIPEGETQQKGR